LQTPGGDDLREEKPFREKAARLLAEADDRLCHQVEIAAGS
jgi:hypothetical protein